MKTKKSKARLSDLVKAAHKAGAEVSVSLEPKTEPYWQVAYQNKNGILGSVSFNSPLGAVQMVSRLLDGDRITAINIMIGNLNARPDP